MNITAGTSAAFGLASPALRRSLARMVRQRVPVTDAEDVAQTVLCDALAAPGLPSDPEDLRRFVAGIARHKVADFHRGARRHRVEEHAADGLEVEPSVEPAPLEARAILARIADSVANAASPRERQTLEWLVREHAGEELKTIADESGVPAPAVRQRVSRLRRLLRAQWGHALALLVLAGTCGAVAQRGSRDGSAIVADPGSDAVGVALLPVQGSWRIVSMTPHVVGEAARQDSAREDAARALESKIVDIRIHGRRVELVTPTQTRIRTIGQATRRADGSIAIDLLDGAGAVQHITATLVSDDPADSASSGSGERLQLVVHDGRLEGTAQLARK